MPTNLAIGGSIAAVGVRLARSIGSAIYLGLAARRSALRLTSPPVRMRELIWQKNADCRDVQRPRRKAK
jgi:hypothetical protein